jgi:hypothetical protein
MPIENIANLLGLQGVRATGFTYEEENGVKKQRYS